jgi:hypothetical protein
MSSKRVLAFGVALLLGVWGVGCSHAYHHYPPCSCIPYTYCPQPPLPYVTYGSCHCPTPIASGWQAGRASGGAVFQVDTPRPPCDSSDPKVSFK